MTAPSPHVPVYALVKAFLADRGRTRVFREPPSNVVDIVPIWVVARFGGGRQPVTVDTARFDLETFASTGDTAESIAEAVDAEVMTLLRGYIFDGSVVTRVECMTAPRLIPWASGDVWRAQAAYQLKVHRFVGVAAA